jgi:hypothetical protein
VDKSIVSRVSIRIRRRAFDVSSVPLTTSRSVARTEVETSPSANSGKRRNKLRSWTAENTPEYCVAAVDWARQGVDTRYNGSAPPRPMMVHPMATRRETDNTRCVSCSSDGNRLVSVVTDLPAFETSVGIDGMRGARGNRKELIDELSLFARKLKELVQSSRCRPELTLVEETTLSRRIVGDTVGERKRTITRGSVNI